VNFINSNLPSKTKNASLLLRYAGAHASTWSADMSTLWFYAHDEKKLGPFSQLQLKEMAAAGTILPTDMVWLEGVVQGALASRIKNLFPHAAVTLPAAVVPAPERIVVNTALVPLEKIDAPKPKEPEKPKRKGRAVALKGADIVGQDGMYARYRKKCGKCGNKDASCHMIPIANKLIKDNYFCPKCRKRCEVAIQCNT
jgi:hypothetical protein